MAFGNRDKTTHISSSLTSTRDVVGVGGMAVKGCLLGGDGNRGVADRSGVMSHGAGQARAGRYQPGLCRLSLRQTHPRGAAPPYT